MALVEAGLLPSRRAADKGDRAVRDMREHAVRDGDVVQSEVAFGDALLGVEYLVGTGKPNSTHLDGFTLRLRGGRCLRFPGWLTRRSLGGPFRRLGGGGLGLLSRCRRRGS